MILRPATTSDVGAVHALEQVVFGTDAWSEASVREELTGQRRAAMVARASAPTGDEGSLVGYAVVASAGDVVDVQRIVVHPTHRRQGLARRLLAAVLADVPQRVLLEVAADNEAAIGLYEGTGFTEVARRERYYRDGSDALVMQRPARGNIGVTR